MPAFFAKKGAFGGPSFLYTGVTDCNHNLAWIMAFLELFLDR
jgi:hypothetical protein